MHLPSNSVFYFTPVLQRVAAPRALVIWFVGLGLSASWRSLNPRLWRLENLWISRCCLARQHPSGQALSLDFKQGSLDLLQLAAALKQ